MRQVYRDIDHALPLHLRGFRASVDASIPGAASGAAVLRGEYDMNREPVRDQLAETQTELDAVTERRHLLQAAARRRSWLSGALALLAAAGIGTAFAFTSQGSTRGIVLAGAGGAVAALLSVRELWGVGLRPAGELDADRLSVQRELLVDRLRRLSMLEELRSESLLGERDRYGETPRRAKGR